MNPDTRLPARGQSIVSNRARKSFYARYLTIAACLLATPGLAKMDNGWELPEAVGQPTFATAIPTDTNLDIEAVVLACERADDGGVLQLQLHPASDDVAMRAIGPPIWSYGRRAEIRIDQRVFSADLLFADDYAVVANETRGRFPNLSSSLLDAMAAGRRMVLRLSVDVETISRKHGVDGYATVDLQAGDSARAIAALRRCANPTSATHDARRQSARS